MKTKKANKRENEKLTLKEVIEILAVYDLEHCRFPHNYMAEFTDNDEIHGMVLDDKKLILIDSEVCTEYAREVVIHELIHVKHYLKGDLPHKFNEIERIVNKEKALTYLDLYGVKI